jgi:hypothetical protein
VSRVHAALQNQIDAEGDRQISAFPRGVDARQAPLRHLSPQWGEVTQRRRQLL